MDIKDFIYELATTKSLEDVVNLYSPNDPGWLVRQTNLRLYLEGLKIQSPKLMMVGEAPGFKGARQTGIPFTSEQIISKGSALSDRLPYWLNFAHYNPDRPLLAEATATIIWQSLYDLEIPPVVFWNAFPFHPHLPGELSKNRCPSAWELLFGRTFLIQLINGFAIEKVIAVGNTAAKILKNMGLDCEKVRHPSYGGKEDYLAGMKAIIEKIN